MLNLSRDGHDFDLNHLHSNNFDLTNLVILILKIGQNQNQQKTVLWNLTVLS